MFWNARSRTRGGGDGLASGGPRVDETIRKGEFIMEELLMLSGKKLKLIKRTERADSQVVGLYKNPTSVPDDREKTKQDAVTIVLKWVNELRRKKAQEAAQGFQSLF